jgi:hypothetical protein
LQNFEDSSSTAFQISNSLDQNILLSPKEKYITLVADLCTELGYPLPSYTFSSSVQGFYCEGRIRGRTLSNMIPNITKQGAKEEVAFQLYAKLCEKKNEVTKKSNSDLSLEEGDRHNTLEAGYLLKSLSTFITPLANDTIELFSIIDKVKENLEFDLSSNLSLTLDHIAVIGSFGKNTFCRTTNEVDLVAFFQNYLPHERMPFMRKLFSYLDQKPHMSRVEQHEDHVGFCFQNINFKLFLARIYLPKSSKDSRLKSYQVLPPFYSALLDHFKSAVVVDPIMMSYCYPAFWEISTMYINSKKDIFRDAIRIFKFWGDLLHFRSVFLSKNIIFELVALKATEVQQHALLHYSTL